MRTYHFSLPVLALTILAACGPEASSHVRDPHPDAPKDEWAGIQRTAEWLYATRDFSGDRKAECTAVLDWVKNEAECAGPLCVHARDLSTEWVQRCVKLVPASSDEVRELIAVYSKR